MTSDFINNFIYNKQLYFMKGICWYHIWSHKNTNLINLCVLFFLHISCSVSFYIWFSLNLSNIKSGETLYYYHLAISYCVYNSERQ